jgi:hypothetical protein
MTAKPTASVKLCSDADIPASFLVLSKSFAHDAPFVDIYYPQHDTSAGQTKGSARLLAWKRDAKDSFFLKAVTQSESDSSREEIIGLAIWTHMKEPPPADFEKVERMDETWPDGSDREFMKALWREYVIPRSEAVEKAGSEGLFGEL